MQNICAEVKKNKQQTFNVHQMCTFFKKSLIINLMSVIMCTHMDQINPHNLILEIPELFSNFFLSFPSVFF